MADLVEALPTPEALRKRILEVVLQTGGHLASSLGAVEIARALAEVFDPMIDRIVWDVGHQAYAWKLLTGRDATFETLRQFKGLSGFPNPNESPADAAIAGHAGVAISVAEGYAAARDRRGSSENVVAVLGDGALANGTSFEALNNCALATKKLIVVLNDNQMGISRSTGGIARLLGRLITDLRYNRAKRSIESAGHRYHLSFLSDTYHWIESHIKSWFLPNAFFEGFGLRYIGPIDGHDLEALVQAFTVAKEDKRSVLVHVVTQKGKGYAPAEKDPVFWHGISGTQSKGPKKKGWSAAFGEALSELARSDARVVALTAAMKDGTGLADFAKEFPDRFFDVGIAEGHMAAFAGGLAAGGLRPFVAVYSTFLQRAIDQVMHDVCIANLPVVFCVDRAGVVGADGVTHQGVYDFAMLKCLPNLTIVQPKDVEDLHLLMKEALDRKGPTVIRYPRGAVPEVAEVAKPAEHPRYALWVTADWLPKANAIAAEIPCVVVPVRSLKPLDTALLKAQRAAGLKIVSVENLALAGGLGESLGADLRFGWPDHFIPHGSPSELEQSCGLDVPSLLHALA